jgi:homoserine acetyltransferase
MGPYEGEVTQLADNGLLASRKNVIPKTVPIAASARLDGETLLPKGMVMALVTDDQDADYGLYKEFDNSGALANGQEQEDNIVVLQHDVNVVELAIGETKTKATGLIEAVLKPDKIKMTAGASVDWAAHPSLSIWPKG